MPAGEVGAPKVALPSAGARFRAFLRRHPVLFLLILTPGIPEYLSGSSALSGLVLNPLLFLLLLAGNLGLYGPGALLIREALVRFRKGWGSLLLLGTAYAILEEGVALSTFFNPSASQVGALGSYGHFLGVSWIWALGLAMFHTVYSIALPILLLSLAIPETRGRTLLSNRQLALTLLLLLADVTILLTVVAVGVHFWMGVPLLIGSGVAIAILASSALRLPGEVGSRAGKGRRFAVGWFVVAGLILFPLTLVLEGVPGALGAPAAVTLLIVGAFYAAWGDRVLPALSAGEDPRARVALATGLLIPVMVFGFLAGLALPVVVVADGVAVWFLSYLWARHPVPAAVRPGSVAVGTS
jgi:hypothetical protein